MGGYKFRRREAAGFESRRVNAKITRRNKLDWMAWDENQQLQVYNLHLGQCF
jgi:hypothetical protein